MNRPRLLDAFCGAGGAARGYQAAGFHVTGVDNRPQPRYAGDEFVLGDALEYLAAHGREYDAVHASPPCHAYSVGSAASRRRGRRYPDLVADTRVALIEVDLPYVIENVPGSPIRPDLVLCGCMFAETPQLMRRRWFELSWPVAALRPPCHHPDPVVTVLSNGSAGPNQQLRPMRGAQWQAMRQRAMGIDWMTRRELGQAIPPAYTRWLGEQLRDHLTPARVAAQPGRGGSLVAAAAAAADGRHQTHTSPARGRGQHHRKELP
jgi:DNA (cytosine-5)-methyltransferase 1